MMALRDILIKIDKYPQGNGKMLYTTISAEHPDYPITPNAIRMNIFKVG